MNALVARCRAPVASPPPGNATPGARLVADRIDLRCFFLAIVALLVACASPEPVVPPSPPPTIADTTPSEQLPIDGIWQIQGSSTALVQLDRGRLYVQVGGGTDRRYGELLYADIHQAGPTTYRCREPVRIGDAYTFRKCELTLAEGLLIAPTPGDDAGDSSPVRFSPIALADDIWYEAQAETWHIVSIREAHRPVPEVVTLPIAPLPELPPSPPVEQPLLPPADASPYGAYYALVVGTGDYAYLPAVATAVEDADAVSALLRERYGFDVTDLRDPTQAELLAAIDGYVDSLGEGDNLLLYFAGQGVMSEEFGRCSWFAADATGDDPGEGLSSDDLAEKFRELEALRVLVVADSCFTASEPRTIELDEPEGGALKEAPRLRTRVVLTSGGLEPVQAGAGGAHSVFTGALLQALSTNDGLLDGTTLSAEILRIVTAGASQSPEYGDIRGADHEGGDFFFVVDASLE